MNVLKNISLGFLALLLAACSQEPVEIHYGSDECRHCKMMITDPRFASQIVTEKGKAYTFDSIECMAVYYRNQAEELQGARLWVNNFDRPGEWLDASDAQYVKSKEVQSPMGESLLAFPSRKQAQSHLRDKAGIRLGWEEVSKVKTNM